MSIYLKIAIATLASATALAGGIYRYTRPTVRPIASVQAVDISDSVKRNCGCLVTEIRKKFNAPTMAKGSVTIIASGTDATADEPSLIAAYDVPSTRKVVEGSKATQRKQDTLLADLARKCEALPVTKRSPITLLVRRGLERLRHAGCGPHLPGCELAVQTDGEETAEGSVKKLLAGSDSLKGTKPLFDNTGITVTFINLSETVGTKTDAAGGRQRLTANHDSAKAQRLQDVWRSLFTQPDGVRFEPFCAAN
jgi:hypothetical protein